MYGDVVSPIRVYAHPWWWPLGMGCQPHGPTMHHEYGMGDAMAVLVTPWLATVLDVWWG